MRDILIIVFSIVVVAISMFVSALLKPISFRDMPLNAVDIILNLTGLGFFVIGLAFSGPAYTRRSNLNIDQLTHSVPMMALGMVLICVGCGIRRYRYSRLKSS